MSQVGASERPPRVFSIAEALRTLYYSPRTEQSYRRRVKRYTFFHHVRYPAEMAEPEINAFLTHLAVREKVSVSTRRFRRCCSSIDT
jgi:Phage integrase, N-terminal SAM-like domain